MTPFGSLYRHSMSSASRSGYLRRLATSTRTLNIFADRFVAGETTTEAIAVARTLAQHEVDSTIGYLGENVSTVTAARYTRDAYLELLDALEREGLGSRAEVSVKLSALGQKLAVSGTNVALSGVRAICAKADAIGTTVTLDMEDYSTIDSTFEIFGELHSEYPRTGVVVQSYLFRSAEDVANLAAQQARIRLVKGAYGESAEVAYQDKASIDDSYVRCVEILMASDCYPMVASHDSRMLKAAERLAALNGRRPGEYEIQMLYGVRDNEQRRLAASGHKVRAYVPYGADWYGYLVRRLAERPANFKFILRSLLS